MAVTASEQTIVVVEDDARIADLLDLYLRDAGFRPLLARTGERALELVRGHRPVLAVVDVGLPGIDGFEVARQIKHEYGNAVRIIAVSAYASENDRRQSLEAGCELHLVKPADPRFIESLLG